MNTVSKSDKSDWKVSNTGYITGMREIRRSNASGFHADKRYKRKRTRSAAVRSAIKDYYK